MELQPNYAMAYYWYAGVLNSEERREETLAALEMAARLEPLSGRMQAELGNYHNQDGNLETAMAYWHQAIDVDPTAIQSYGGIIDHLYYSGQLVQFMLVVNQYIENGGDKHLWGLYLPLMWAYRSMYDLDAADFWLDRLLDSDAPESLIPHERVLALMAHHDFEQVGTILHSWVSNALDDRVQLNKIAWYELIVGHDDHARRLYDRVAELGANAHNVENSTGFDISFGGHYPDVNKALLMMRDNASTVAEDMLARCREYIANRLSENSRYPAGNLHVLAAIDAVEGNRSEALEGLRRAIDAGWTRAWFTEQDPNFASLRDDPEFQQIIAESKATLEGMREQVHLAIGADPGKLFSSIDH
jgi:tetratricopeptide (TPR) repeat protein